MYILPTDNIFQSASGIIHEITPKYSNFRDAIQIEFRYNLDSFFHLEIRLSEFDQPESIKLYSNSSEFYSDVTDIEDSYNLVSDEVVVVIEKDAILDIVNNLASYQTFYEDMTIDLKIIKPQQDRSTRPLLSKFDNWIGGLSFDINSEKCSYYDGGINFQYEPILGTSSFGEKRPYKAEFNYFFYDIDDFVPGHSLLLAPPKDFIQNYLFRGDFAISTLSLTDRGTVILNGKTMIEVNNGLVRENGVYTAFDDYIDLKKDEEYKTLLFNAAYDRNLYTEISLLIPSVRHNGMSIYDFEKNTIVRGSISQKVLIDPATDIVSHSIKMSNTRDFFSEDYPYDFEFSYDPKIVFNKTKIDSLQNAAHIGSLYRVDKSTGHREQIPLHTGDIQKNRAKNITASNNKIFVSLSRNRIETFTKDRMIQNGLPKLVSSSDSIHGIYSIESIDYTDEIITVSAGTKNEEYSFSDPKINTILSSVGQSALLREYPLDIGGITLNMPAVGIDMDFINIETFNDATLLTRVAESPDYGIEKIVRDCNRFVHHIFIDFGMTQLLLIFNQRSDKIYYIEFSRKVVNTDSGNLDNVISRLITIDDERKVKDFLLFHSLGKGFNHIPGVSQVITSDTNGQYSKRVDSIATVRADMSLGRFAFISNQLRDYNHIVSGTAGEILYSPREYRNGELVSKFKKNKVNFRTIANGVLSNNDHEISSLNVDGDSMNINVHLGEASADLTISINGGAHEFKNGTKINIETGNETIDSFLPFAISSTAGVSKVFQVFDMIIVEFETFGSIAFNYPAVAQMINNGNLAIAESISYLSEGKLILVRSDAVSQFDCIEFSNLEKEKAYPVYQNENYDIILDIISKSRWDGFLDGDIESQNLEIEVHNVVGSMQGVALPIEYTKFFQYKEQ